MSFASIECHDCPGHKRCPKPGCDHCVAEREQELSLKNAIVALPYYYQDVCKDVDASTLGNDTHVLRYVEANGQIHTKLQDTIVPLSNRTVPGATYEVSVYDQSVAKGQIKNAVISAENNRNEAARKLANTRREQPAYQTLWVQNLSVPIEDDMVTIRLQTDKLSEAIQYNIEFPVDSSAEPQAVSKRMDQYAKRQIRLKGYNPLTHVGLKAQNTRLIVDTANGVLKDVEFDLAYPDQSAARAETQVFTCDPQDIDQVTGLVMALEEHIQQKSFGENTQRATELLHVINQHRSELEKSLIGNSVSITVEPRINAAVQEATDMLWEAVGLTLNPGVRYHQRKMEQENKPGRDFGIEYAERIVPETLEKYQEALEGKNFIKKAMLKRRLKNLLGAIERREKSLTAGSDLFTRYFNLEAKLSQALKYGVFE